MQLTILGCGGSMGVPMLACDCEVCTSNEPRNQRTRTAALIHSATTTILIDPGPDLRLQGLRHNLQQLDAVLVTHPHQDHIGGIDDLRPFTLHTQRMLPLYANQFTLDRIRYQYDYAFASGESASTRPSLGLNLLDGSALQIGDVPIMPLPIDHGNWQILGFRIGDLAYITDVSHIPEPTFELLHGVKSLIIGALRHEPHPLHFTVEQALAAVARIQPEQAFFVHMSHSLDYTTEHATLPKHVQLAYDGLVLPIGE